MTHRMLWSVYDLVEEEYVLIAVFLDEDRAVDYADVFDYYVEPHPVENAQWLSALS